MYIYTSLIHLHQLPDGRFFRLKQPRGAGQVLAGGEFLHVVDERAGEGDGLALLL